MLVIPFALFVAQSSSMPDIENEIQKQLNMFSNEIIFSLSDCEKKFLSSVSHSFIVHWLKIKKNDQFDSKIINSISNEMVQLITKKYKLKLIKIDEFKLFLVFVFTGITLQFGECSVDTAVNATCFHLEHYEKVTIRPVKKTKISSL